MISATDGRLLSLQIDSKGELHVEQLDSGSILELIQGQSEEIRRLRERLDRAEAMTGLANAVGSESDRSFLEPAATREAGETRRAFLRVAGLGTLTAAAAVLIRPDAAAASDGQSVLQGSASDATNVTATTTTVTNSGSSGLAVAGLRGVGPSNSNGVLGTSNGSLGAGLLGTSDTGYGVIGQSANGYALYAGSNGRIGLDVHLSGDGPPVSGVYQLGDIVRDATGNVWCCVVAGSPGSFRKIAGPAAAGGFHFLSSPVRAYDSRPAGAPPSGVKSPLVAVGARSLSLSGTIPSGTTGVALNVAVVTIAGPGFVAAYQSGVSYPGTSNVNWTAAGQIVGNVVLTAVSSSGSLDLYCGQGSADVIVDVFGYFR